jgi:hypothetical protein
MKTAATIRSCIGVSFRSDSGLRLSVLIREQRLRGCFRGAGNRGYEAGQEEHGDEDGGDNHIVHCYFSFPGEAVLALSTT